MRFKSIFYQFLIYVIILSHIGCSASKNMSDSEKNSESVVQKVNRISENSIEFVIQSSENELNKSYTLIKDGEILKNEENFTGKILILNALEEGKYSIIFKIQGKESTYRTMPYEFDILKSEKKAEINDIEIIKKENQISLRVYIKNKDIQELYLKEFCVKFYAENGENMSNKFKIKTEFIPSFLKVEQEKIIEINYDIEKIDFDKIYVEINADGYTETERRMIKIVNDKRYSKVIGAEDIDIKIINQNINLLENEKTEVIFTVKEIKKGNVDLAYGEKNEKFEFYENEVMVFYFDANKKYKTLNFTIEELDYKKNIELNIVEKEEIVFETTNIIKKDENFDVKIKNYKNLNKNDFYVELGQDFSLINIFEGDIYVLKALTAGEKTIKLYYKNEFICEKNILVEENEKIIISELEIEEKEEELNIKGKVEVKNSNIFRFKKLNSKGIEIKDIYGEDYEILSRQKGKVDIEIISHIENKEDIALEIYYEEVETSSIYKIKIF